MFPCGVGNTRKDPKAFASLIHDVETKIFDALPDETWVYPGMATTRRWARSGRICRSGTRGAGDRTPGARPRARAPCESFTRAGVMRALPACVVAQSTGSSPAQDDGS